MKIEKIGKNQHAITLKSSLAKVQFQLTKDIKTLLIRYFAGLILNYETKSGIMCDMYCSVVR